MLTFFGNLMPGHKITALRNKITVKAPLAYDPFEFFLALETYSSIFSTCVLVAWIT